MEDNQANEVRLFTPVQIAVASFVGAPLAACWLFSRNLRSVGENRSAKKWMIGGIVGTVVLLAVTDFLPDYVPDYLPIAYTIGFYQIALRSFAATYFDELDTEGAVTKGAWWTVIAISLFCFATVVALLFALDKIR